MASLTTLGTPHHGTTFADWAVQNGLAGTVTAVLGLLGIDFLGLEDLTTTACRKRNRLLENYENRNSNRILYQTYAGVQDMDDVFWPLLPSYRVIRKMEGINDGLVAVDSAKWKDAYFRGIRDWDHLNFLGWWEPAELDLLGGRAPRTFRRQARTFYQDLARALP